MKHLVIALSVCAIYLFSANNVFAQDDRGDKIINSIFKNPKNIREYDKKDILALPIDHQLEIIQTILFGIPENQISRADMKRYYIPLVLSSFDSLFNDDFHETLTLLSKGRVSNISNLLKKNDTLKGPAVTEMFKYTKRLYTAVMCLVVFDSIPEMTRYSRGNLRFVERELFSSNSISDIYFPVPDTLLNKLDSDFIVDRNDMYMLDSVIAQANMMYHNDDCTIIFKHYKELLEISAYVDSYLHDEFLSHIESCVERNDTSVNMIEVYKDSYLYDKGSGGNKMSSVLILYAKNMARFMDTLRSFYQYRDELYNRYHYEFAKYSPYKCPNDIKTPELEFKNYTSRFINVLATASSCGLFLMPQINEEMAKMMQTTFNVSTIWSDILHEAYYAWFTIDNDNALTIIEQCVSYLDGTSALNVPINDFFLIAEIYLDFNIYKMRDILNKHCRQPIENMIDKYNKKLNNSEDDFVLAWNLVHLSYFYSYFTKNPYRIDNKYREISIRKYLNIVRDIDISKKEPSYNYIQSLIAETYLNMGDYDESMRTLSSIKNPTSDISDRKRYIEAQNAYYNDDDIELYKICKSMHYDHLSPKECAKCFYASKLNKDKVLAEAFSVAFSKSVGGIFSNLEIFSSGDREVCQNMSKRNIEAPFFDTWLDLSVGEFVGDSAIEYRNKFAAMVYDYSLAFKGSVLQANSDIKKKIRGTLDEEFRIMDSINYMQLKTGDTNLFNKQLNKYNDLILYGEIRAIHKERSSVNYEDVASSLPPKSIAVEFVELAKNEYLAVCIRDGWDYPIIYDVYINDMKYDSLDNYSSLFSDTLWLKKMYDRIWKPLEKYIDKTDSVYFSLDGLLNLMAVEQFLDSNSMSANMKFNLFRVSSTSKIPRSAYLSSMSQITLFGNLDYLMDVSDFGLDSRTDINSIGVLDYCFPPRESLNTENEITDITGIIRSFGKIKIEPYLGKEGTEKQFKKLSGKKIDIIHLATHGFYCKDNDSNIPAMQRTGIVLSGSDEIPIEYDEAGLLFASEISDLDLSSVKLLVLSACNTGFGEDKDDGIYGIHRGFLQAGVGSIIMTLWPVNNDIATEFMSLFYSRLVSGENIHAAFTDTQTIMQQKYKDNNNWMTFVLLN